MLEMSTLTDKCVHKNARKSFASFFYINQFDTCSNNTITTTDHRLYLPLFETLKLQGSLKYQGVKIWNSVLGEIKHLSHTQFK